VFALRRQSRNAIPEQVLKVGNLNTEPGTKEAIGRVTTCQKKIRLWSAKNSKQKEATLADQILDTVVVERVQRPGI
jgi:hypothetical protein